jgi:hypothetical protein
VAPLKPEVKLSVVDENEADRIIRGFFAWVAYPRNGSQRETTMELDEVFAEVAVEMARDDPEALWPIILQMVADAPDEHHLGAIGAAPLENLLTFHGLELVDRVEAAARADARFRTALGYVDGWSTSITPDVTDRLRPFLSVGTPESRP